MKKLILVLFMPLFVISAIVGIGFGIWYYDDTMTTINNTNTNVSVEGVSECGKVEIQEKHKIKVLVTQRSVKLTQQIKVKYEHYDQTNVDYPVDFSKVKFTYILRIPKQLHNYIDVYSPDLDTLSPPTYGVDAYNQEYAQFNGVWKPTNLDPITPNVYWFSTQIYFSYKEGMKPKTKQDVLNMLKFKGSTIEVTFYAAP